MRSSSELQLEILPREPFSKTWLSIEAAIQSGVAPGMVAGVWSVHDVNRAWVLSSGQRRSDSAPLPMEVDTPFDLASLTKVICTATLTAILVERGSLSWNSKARLFLDGPHLGDIEVHHLLSHTAGFVAWRAFWEELRARFGALELAQVSVEVRQLAMREILLSITPEARPGQRCLYSDISALLMGFILEEATRLPLDQAVEQMLWQPLGLDGFKFYRTDSAGSRALRPEIAATENSSWRGGVLQGQVHDDNCWAMGGFGGHAGVFGSVRDVLFFARRLFEGKISPAVLTQMWTRVTEPPGCERTMGWDTPTAAGSSAGARFSRRSVGHLGFTGVSLWMDLDAGIAVTLLTNRVHPSRENNQIREFRPLFHDALREEWDRFAR